MGQALSNYKTEQKYQMLLIMVDLKYLNTTLS